MRGSIFDIELNQLKQNQLTSDQLYLQDLKIESQSKTKIQHFTKKESESKSKDGAQASNHTDLRVESMTAEQMYDHFRNQ